jgi:hypothetical protein
MRATATLLVALVALGTASATSLFATPSFRDTDTCGFLPVRPPLLPPLPSAGQDVCAKITCPSAPSACYEVSESERQTQTQTQTQTQAQTQTEAETHRERMQTNPSLRLRLTFGQDSICINGLCLAPLPKPFGTPCDDGRDNTVGDVCGEGVCAGLSVSCPNNVFLKPGHVLGAGEQLAASWEEPKASYAAGASIHFTSNFQSGDLFPAGVHNVKFTADVDVPGVGVVSSSCSFDVTVYADPSTNEAMPCHADVPCDHSRHLLHLGTNSQLP